ncbi:hypothetical protein IKC_06206 [Bacillus cereus VD184]|uniref:Uncharacterized protein n=1 Tax=Bacillus cereus VD184 TaxID=1053242 RepID=A0A9W5R0G6_BACCE|nr:hypothetical protein IKC_06206 [Bacillus cereus VD184]
MKKVKSVAFNVADTMEYGMFHYAGKQQYFSTYVKRLIQRDMEDGKRVLAEMDNETYNAYNGKSNEQIKLENAKESITFLHESGLVDEGQYYKTMFQIQSELEKVAH